MSLKTSAANTPPTTTEALLEIKRQAVLKKDALKLAKTAHQEAEESWKKARKDSRKAAKLALKARQQLDKLERKFQKSEARAAAGPTQSKEDPS